MFRSDLEVNINGFAATCGTGKLCHLRLIKESLKHLCAPSVDIEGGSILSEFEGQRFGSPVEDRLIRTHVLRGSVQVKLNLSGLL